ncbi:MAG TPA: hypothetical protein VFK94_02735 [Patescibacteria group bacterium]|nr:hypothetical protein [Patescibacteria group bacterium]
MSEATATVSAPLDEFGQDAKNRLATTIEQRNALVAQLKATQGDPQELLEALRETSDDPQIVKMREQINTLNDKLYELETKRDEALKPLVEQMRAEAAQGSEGVSEKADALDKTIKAGMNYLKELYGEAALEGLPSVLPRKNRATPGKGGGEGGKRIRGFDWTVDGILQTSRDAKGVERSNTAAAAKAIGVETATLQEKFWEAAGTRDSAKYPARVEFTVSVGEGDDAKTHTVVAARLTEDETPQTKAEAS